MTVQATHSVQSRARLLLVVAAAAGLVLSLALTTHQVQAGGNPCGPPDTAGYACLKDTQQGTDSSDPGDQQAFACESDKPAPGLVVWHFVLNGLDPGITSSLTIHALFDGDGELTDDSNGDHNPGGSEHQFFVTTSGDDVLLDAWVWIDGSEYNNLVLSHICRGDEVEQSQSPEGSVGEGTGSPSATPEGSQLGGTGTPAPSVPNTAMSLPNLAGPLSTVAFGLILLASLGGLAYANVKAVRRR